MKKSIIFVLLLSLLSVQQIHAQKWLKKLGKVAETVLTNDQKTNKALMTALVLLIARMSNIRCTSIWVAKS